MRMLPVVLALAAIACTAPLLASKRDNTTARASALRESTLEAISALDEKGQKAAKRYLKDRVASNPVSCIPQTRLRRSTAASDDVLLYDDGATIYVNTPYLGCPGARGNAMISSTPAGRLCSGDIVLVQDLIAGVQLGSCSLGEFVPFRKVKQGN